MSSSSTKTKPKVPKFTHRCRLFVGNISQDTAEQEFIDLFSPFGELSEVYLNTKRGFGFIRYDSRSNAEKAKEKVHGQVLKERPLRVHFAPHGAALKVTHIPKHVTNELIWKAFSVFGELERAVALVNDRGTPTGEGIVEFVRKSSAMMAMKRIENDAYLLTSELMPVTVELYTETETEYGVMDATSVKSPEHLKTHELPPRFALTRYEYDYATRFRDMYELEKREMADMEKKFEAERMKIELAMDQARKDAELRRMREYMQRQERELLEIEERTASYATERQKAFERRRAELAATKKTVPKPLLATEDVYHARKPQANRGSQQQQSRNRSGGGGHQESRQQSYYSEQDAIHIRPVASGGGGQQVQTQQRQGQQQQGYNQYGAAGASRGGRQRSGGGTDENWSSDYDPFSYQQQQKGGAGPKNAGGAARGRGGAGIPKQRAPQQRNVRPQAPKNQQQQNYPAVVPGGPVQPAQAAAPMYGFVSAGNMQATNYTSFDNNMQLGDLAQWDQYYDALSLPQTKSSVKNPMAGTVQQQPPAKKPKMSLAEYLRSLT